MSDPRCPSPDAPSNRGPCLGRRPAGLCSQSSDLGHNRLGDFLARCAHMEAASAIAFERLASELTAHDAPDELILDALEAREDEVRHARVLGNLARQRGGRVVSPVVSPLDLRDLSAIALENVVEGCVRETYGALVSGCQARRAVDRALRDALVVVARDEVRHAALAHRVHRWIEPRLSPRARIRVGHARERAMFALVRESAIAPDPYVQRLAGLPTPEVAAVLLQELRRVLWRPRGGASGRAARA